MAPNLHKAVILHTSGSRYVIMRSGTAQHVKDPRLPCEVATMNSLPGPMEALGKRNLAQNWVLVRGFIFRYDNKETIVIYIPSMVT